MSFEEYRQSLLDFSHRITEGRELFSGLFPDAYESSYANPAYAVKSLGEDGGILSMLYADLFAVPAYSIEGRVFEVTSILGILKKVCECKDTGEAAGVIVSEYIGLASAFAKHNIIAMIDPKSRSAEYFKRMLDAPLEDYRVPISDNERRLRDHLEGLSRDEITSMAATFVNGYRDGFLATQKDISIKDTVKIEYPIGFEPVVREAIRLFGQLGLEPTFVREALTSVEGRAPVRRGVYTTGFLRQFLYDHREDRAYYFNEEYVDARLNAMEKAFEDNRELAAKHGGPAVTEVFGEPDFSPLNKPENKSFSKSQNELFVSMTNRASAITNRYIPGEERSFTIIAYPLPSIGGRFSEIFDATIGLNTLDSSSYKRMHQSIIDVLDKGSYVRVKGRGDNATDMKVMLHHLDDASSQTNFENCVADVNIPVGEVFTSPVLEGTSGTLHVSRVYLGDYEFKNLIISFEDGMVKSYSCDNFKDQEEGRRLIFERILNRHETLPIGEFAIGTNTRAYRMAKDFGIESKLPILIAEKCGPHFAVGDTCYSHAEDVPMYNPDGKECIARDNSVSILRKEDAQKAYFNCHTDITVPFDELEAITAVSEDGREYDIIRDGRFVVEGTFDLNEPLD